jgi:hypothetical protein
VCNGEYKVVGGRMLSYFERRTKELKKWKKNYEKMLAEKMSQDDVSTVVKLINKTIRSDKNIGRQMDAIEK